MRHADDAVRPVIDAVLDALGVLGGVAGELERPLRPLAGLLADPAGWLRSPASLAAQPAKIQGLLDALRPLLGIGGAPGDPIELADGVLLTVTRGRTGGPAGAERRRRRLDRAGHGRPPRRGRARRPRRGSGRSARCRARRRTPASRAPPPAARPCTSRLGSTGIALFVRPTTGADIPLVPFAGLGSLAAAAAQALPFLLDRLAEVPGAVGEAVAGVGDALALRTGSPAAFDGTRLTAWAADPVGALTAAVPSIVATGLSTLAPLIDDLVPGQVNVTTAAGELRATAGDVSLAWNPTTGVVTLRGDGVAVPGIEQVSFAVGIGASGLAELAVTVGPAAIDTGAVVLRPFVTVAAGQAPAGGRRVAVGLAVDDTHRFAARWLLDPTSFAFVASDGPLDLGLPDDPDPVAAALRMVEVIADLVVAVALSTPAVQDVLDLDVGARSVRQLLAGVVLEDSTTPTGVIAGLFDPDTLLARAQRLFENLVDANLSITIEGVELSLVRDASNVIGLNVGFGAGQRMTLFSSDVTLWLENDDRWITPDPPGDGGIFVGVLSTAGQVRFRPKLAVNGLGLRIGKTSGPLLDVGVTLESIALHVFAELDHAGVKGGGVQLQFSNLAVSASGGGGDNGIAQGVVRDTGPQPPQAGLLARARDPEARQPAGRRHAARRRRRRAVVDRHPAGLRPAVPGADRLRRRRCPTGASSASRC